MSIYRKYNNYGLFPTQPSEEKSAIEKMAQILAPMLSKALNYQSIGRKIFTVDDLPPGAKANYIKTLKNVFGTIGKQSKLTAKKNKK
jgi:hypothetical protein